jgi:hypothetical protein
VSWKLSRTVLRGGTNSNVGPLLGRQRYGCVNEHNGWVPRDFWLEPWEKEAIIEFHLKNPLEGYRRLTFMYPAHHAAPKRQLEFPKTFF